MHVTNAARSLATALALGASSASGLELHGYFRDSVGFNSRRGGGQACFQLPGSDFKARLGNECERYLELVLAQTGTVANTDWRVEFMGASYQPSTSGTAANNLFLQEMWGSLTFRGLRGISLWGGRRYYKRHDVHSIDWFYWNPFQGNAAIGVEDVPLGFGKLALAVIRIDSTASSDTVKNLVYGTYAVADVRLYDAPVNPGGTLELGVDLAIAYDQKQALGEGRAGWSPLLTIQHNQTKLLGGTNTFAFQYGSGAFANSSGDGPGLLIGGATTHHKQWRIIEHLVVNPVPAFSGAFVVIYQNKTTPGTTANGAHIFTAEMRPAVHLCDYFKLAVDLFLQTLSLKNAPAGTGTGRLLKATVAPTFVLGRGYWARPEIRLFVTLASWNAAAAASGTIGSGAFPATARHGISAGGSIETWF